MGVSSFFPRWTLCFFVLIALAAPGAPGAVARIFDPVTFTLDNGLQVVVITNRRAPIVTHMVWYKAGAADEAAGQSGVAHFLEHLMFKGTETLGPGEFSEIIARNGGRENAFTSHDYTAYFQTIARDRLDTVMKFEADRMANLKLTDEVVLPERDVVLEERRSRIGNNPGSQLSEALRAALFVNHPYRLPVIGWEHEIQALSREAVVAFYRRWYAPNNAVLIVAGDVSAGEVRELAEVHYGPIPARDVPARLRPAEPEPVAARRVVMKSPRVRQPSLTIKYLAPSYNTGASEQAYALQVLDEILGGGSTGRLYRALVVEQALAAGAGSGYGASDLDLSTFSVYASPRPGVEIEALEAALRRELSQLIEQGVEEAEVADAKKRLVAAAVYARDRLSTGPRIFGSALATGQTVEDVESWPDRIATVTVEEVDAALRAVLRDHRSVTGVLLPEPSS